MIDTNTVNFAVTKMSKAWQSAAPQLANVSEEYIRFVVMKALIPIPIILFFTAISIVSVVIGCKWCAQIKKEGGYPEAEVSPIVFGSIGLLICAIALVICGYYALLAINYPEMFTVHQLLQAAK